MFVKEGGVGKGRLSSYVERFWNKKAFSVLMWEQSLCKFHLKQVDSTLPSVCSVIDYKRRQNAVRTSVTTSFPASSFYLESEDHGNEVASMTIASCATFLSLQHFDAFCDLVRSLSDDDDDDAEDDNKIF